MRVDAFPSVSAESIGWLTTEQMIEVDRVMIEDLHIELLQMMENAGRNLARVALELFDPTHVTVCAGSGGNGGGGLVAARHLHLAGADVEVVLAAARDRFTPVPAHQLEIIDRIGLDVLEEVPSHTELIIDAIIGYSLRGEPRGLAAEVMTQVMTSSAPVLSLDTPSGLDTTSSTVADLHIAADATVTLALPKVGLSDQPVVGELYLADISVPPSVYDRLGTGPAPDFSSSPILRVR